MRRNLVLSFILLVALLPAAGWAHDYEIASVEGVMRTEVALFVLEAYDRIGVPAYIVSYPGERALYMSSNGLSDAELLRTSLVGKLYDSLIMVPVSLGEYRVAAFTRPGIGPIRTWEDLRPYHVGVERGLRLIEEATKQLHPVYYDDRTLMFSLLNKGRLDAVVFIADVGQQFVRTLQLDNVIMQKTPLASGEFYHYVHKHNAHLIPALAATMRTMLQEGAMERIAHELRQAR